jgi:hypothetical protein
VNDTVTKYVRIMKQTAFWRGKTESIYHVKTIQYLYLLNKYIKWNFGGLRCGTSTIVDIRRLKVNAWLGLCVCLPFYPGGGPGLFTEQRVEGVAIRNVVLGQDSEWLSFFSVSFHSTGTRRLPEGANWSHLMLQFNAKSCRLAMICRKSRQIIWLG